MSENDIINYKLNSLGAELIKLLKEIEDLKGMVARKMELASIMHINATLKNQRLEKELNKRVVVQVKVYDDKND